MLHFLNFLLVNAWSCPVCFGKSADSQGLVSGLTWGLFILLGFTFLIIGKLTTVIMRVEKLRAAAERQNS